MSNTITGINDSAGQRQYVVAVTVDISARKEQEAAIRQLNEDLQERIAELERFEEAVIGRELKMIELERELEQLRTRVQSTP